MYINKRKSDEMITNKDVIEQGKIVQNFPLDYDPFTGETVSEHGFENLVMYDHKIYSVLTDFTGSVADPSGTPDIVTDDAQTFMEELFMFDDPDQILAEETKAQEEYDYDQWELLDSKLEDDWMRNDDW